MPLVAMPLNSIMNAVTAPPAALVTPQLTVFEPPVADRQTAKCPCRLFDIVPSKLVAQVPPPVTVSTPALPAWKEHTQAMSALPAVAVTVPDAGDPATEARCTARTQ